MSDFNIKEIRSKLGLSQTEFAKRIGVTLRTIQNWESGAKIPESKYEILRSAASSQLTIGNNSPAVSGSGNHVNTCDDALNKALDEISAQRKMCEKSQQQIDELLRQQGRLLDLLNTPSAK